MDETRSNDKADITSEEMSREVLRVFRARISRGQSEPNGKMSDEQNCRFCTLSNQAKELLNAGIERFNLSARSINKTLKTSPNYRRFKRARNFRKARYQRGFGLSCAILKRKFNQFSKRKKMKKLFLQSEFLDENARNLGLTSEILMENAAVKIENVARKKAKKRLENFGEFVAKAIMLVMQFAPCVA